MFSSSALPLGLKLRQPEAIWLDLDLLGPRLRPLANPSRHEAEQWQLYLNRLGLLGFEQWLQKCTPTYAIDQTQYLNEVGAVYNLKLNEFKLNLWVKEHILDEVVEIPREALLGNATAPSNAAHFYLLLEISEEQRRVFIRGFLRHDRLREYCDRLSDHSQSNSYSIPLSVFDDEPNHLLFYCDFLEPSAIPLPEISRAAPIQETRIKLGQWLEGVFAEGWQAIGDLVPPEFHLALSARNQGAAAKRGKLIDLGMEFQGQRAVLLVNIVEEPEEELSVLVQLHPAGESEYLPPQTTLTLISESGETLQEVYSRSLDDYIQLRSFSGRSGIPFRIGVRLDEVCLYEDFEL
jgi:Protein of unknown function (DUF1822)